MLWNHKKTMTKTLLVCCPLNTVLNWKDEWEKWVEPEYQLDVSFCYIEAQSTSCKN